MNVALRVRAAGDVTTRNPDPTIGPGPPGPSALGTPATGREDNNVAVHRDRSELAAIFAGGFMGAIARAVLVDRLPYESGHWPWATFAVNLTGALILGWVATRLAPASSARPLLGAGFCGALTTFATMQLELLEMLDGAHYALAVGYALASVAGGLLAISIGTGLARRGGRTS